MKTKGLWVTPTEFVSFAESMKPLSQQIATRQRSIDFYGLGMYLPNPDPVLKALGKDIKVYRELRSDAHVGGCIRRRKAAVKALEHGIDRDKAKSRIARSIEAMLADLDLTRFITEALDAVLYGYQPMEVMWGKVGSLIVPVDVVGKPANWFIYDENNTLRLLTQAAPAFGEDIPPHKFLVPRQDPTNDNPYGFPDLSMVFWPTTFKKGGLKFWVQFAEKYGSPWVVGKHPRSADDKETDKLLDSLEQMVQDAVAVIPDDSSVEIKEAENGANNAEVYERLLRFCRSEVSIALLGQNQTTESDANRASAQAGLEVTQDIRDGDKAIVVDAINTLIRWTCELNWGSTERPVFDMWEQEEVDKVLAERDEKLTRAGARLTPAYFQRAYGLQEGDIAVEAPAPAPTDGKADFAEAAGGDPDAIDTLIDAINDWQPVLDPLLAPLKAALEDAAAQNLTAAEFIERQPQLLPKMDAGPLAEALTQAAFTARIAGAAGLPLEDDDAA
jgi:phage gp29-like protein